VLSKCRYLGLAGALAITVGGIGAGALPSRDPFASFPGVRDLRAAPIIAVTLAYFGLTLLVAAWLRLGRLLAAGLPAQPRDIVVTLVWWAAPLALAPPMYSRDVYSYLAQGVMASKGIDVYSYGPAILGNSLANDVPVIWQHTPAPYGPVFLLGAAFVMRLAGGQTMPGVYGMRVLALLGLALVVYCVPRLSARFGASGATAIWLGVLNPLVLTHVIVGVHNDALMVGLMLAGLLLALRGHPALGSVAIALAVLVKAPAAVALAFVIPLWADQIRGLRRQVALGVATLRTGAVALGTIVAASALSGFGYGWIGALHTSTVVRNGLSLTTNIGILVGRTGHAIVGLNADRTLEMYRFIGVALALVFCAITVWRAKRLGAPYALGLALTALVLLSPVVHPWYLLWGFIPIAATNRDRLVRWMVVAISVIMAYVVMPDGGGRSPATLFAGAGGLLLGFAVLTLLRPQGPGEMIEGEPVPVDAQSTDDTAGDRGDHRMVPELLARVDVGEVHLHQRRF
jgi:hypothetical protein